MSIALWFYVMGAQNPTIEDTYRVKIQLRNTSYDYKAYYEEREARILLSAPRSYFIDYSENDMRAFADISNYEAGEYDVPVEVTYPKGFELKRISPTTIHVKIEPIIEKLMDVQLIVSGSPSPNTTITSIDAPKQVTILGSTNVINSVQKVVGYVGVVGESENFELDVPLSAIDENGREVVAARVSPPSINVLVNIEPTLKKSVPIIVHVNPPEGRKFETVTVSPSTIEIEGAISVMDTISSLETVDTTIPPDTDTYNGTVKLIIPENVKASAEEVLVTAKLKKQTTDQQQFIELKKSAARLSDRPFFIALTI